MIQKQQHLILMCPTKEMIPLNIPLFISQKYSVNELFYCDKNWITIILQLILTQIKLSTDPAPAPQLPDVRAVQHTKSLPCKKSKQQEIVIFHPVVV